MSTQSQRARGWCFTSFDDFDLSKLPRGATYLCAQQEICPRTGKYHWQGFVYYKNAVRFSTLKGVFPKAHIEAMKGNVDQAISYCSKSQSAVLGTFFELGDRPQQGRRTDIHEVIAEIRAGTEYRDILLDYPEVCSKYLRYIKEVQLFINRPIGYSRRNCLLISGPPGCGKTGIVYDAFGYDQVYDWNWSSKWFDGYSGQQCILIDEFCHRSLDPNFFKKLCDGYPVTREVKGGTVSITSPFIVLLTNEPPDTLSLWYELTPGIKRRVIWWNFYTDAPDELCPPSHSYYQENLEKLKMFVHKNGLPSKNISQDDSSQGSQNSGQESQTRFEDSHSD